MKKHNWKKLFFLLFAVNIVVVVMFLLLLGIPAEDKMIPESRTTEVGNVSFQVKTNKNDLNQVINHYLEKEQSGTISYGVFLTRDEVVLSGKLPIFGEMFDLRMSFEPRALENGDLILEQKKISIGKISLPVSFLLNIINKSYQFPDWVIIQPNKERVYVSFQNMRVKNDIKIAISKFNLKDDDIEFLYIVPVN